MPIHPDNKAGQNIAYKLAKEPDNVMHHVLDELADRLDDIGDDDERLSEFTEGIRGYSQDLKCH